MKKWQNLVAPNDPNSYYDVDGVWPTNRGTYESIAFATLAQTLTATGSGNVLYAYCAKTLTGSREYVVDANKIWEFDGATTLTDRTNGVTIASSAMMAQYGNITICVMGNATATVSSSGGNFSALAGAPKGEIVLVQSNAVLIFNTDTSADGWAASDVGDYTNWTTGEAASGRLIATPGPILAAVVYGNDVFVFKSNSIYRMWYVGGTVKWASQLIYAGVGTYTLTQKWAVVAGNSGVYFLGAPEPISSGYTVYFFDGSSAPIRVNRLNSLSGLNNTARMLFDPLTNTMTLVSSVNNDLWFYNATTDAWGRATDYMTGYVYSAVLPVTATPILGELTAMSQLSRVPGTYTREAANQLKRYIPGGSRGIGSQYVQTAMIGRPDRKTLIQRVVPVLRRRTDVGTQSETLTVTSYRELHDTSAASTNTFTANSDRFQFDGNVSDNFHRVKYAFTDYDVEIDDIAVTDGKEAGKK